MKKGIALIAFTDRGMELAAKLARAFGGEPEGSADLIYKYFRRFFRL